MRKMNNLISHYTKELALHFKLFFYWLDIDYYSLLSFTSLLLSHIHPLRRQLCSVPLLSLKFKNPLYILLTTALLIIIFPFLFFLNWHFSSLPFPNAIYIFLKHFVSLKFSDILFPSYLISFFPAASLTVPHDNWLICIPYWLPLTCSLRFPLSTRSAY